MLAPMKEISEFTSFEPVKEIADYSGFPEWHALMVDPNREQKAADWLERVKMIVYLPRFQKQIHLRGKMHRARLYAVVPGMLFVPREMMQTRDRDAIFKWAGVHGYLRTADRAPAIITKADIELIRQMEARLNCPQRAVTRDFKIGQQVQFVDSLFAYGWGNGVIVELAGHNRIGVEVAKLFGRSTKVYVPASEIEAM